MNQDDSTIKTKHYVIGTELAPYSQEALAGFVKECEEEIQRLKNAITAKKNAQNLAEGFFKKS